MVTHRRLPATPAARAVAGLALAAGLLGALPGCVPVNTGSTYSPYAVGRAAEVRYGTIVGTRPVTVQGPQSGAGTVGGALAGGVAGSFIGGYRNPGANLIGALGGAVLGGLAGTAIERGATTGGAVEFIVRQDEGGDIAVVQSNEEGLQAGERVLLSFGEQLRISRAAGAPPATAGYAPGGTGGYVPQGYVTPGYAPQGYAPGGYAPAGVPQGYVGGPARYEPGK